MTSHPITRLAALALAASLSACDLLGEDKKSGSPEGVSGLASARIGQPLDSLAAVGALAFRDGTLYVADGHATAPGVAAVDTATGLITAYYPTTIAPNGLAFTASGALIVTQTDYESGAVSVIDPETKRIRQDVLPFGSDPAVALVDGKVFLFDRFSGAVTGFTGNTPGKSVKFDVQAGAGSNPYAIAIEGGKAYVTRYNSTHLLILGDAGSVGGGARDSIDLSAYAATALPDTVAKAPRMAQVTAFGGRVFVTVQRLNHQYAALDTSLVLVIDPATKTVEKTIPLTFRNPVSATVRDGVWYIAGEQGGMGDGNLLGGVEKIDLATQAKAGVVVTEATLGGDVSAYVSTGAGGYAAYGTGWPVYKVKKVAPAAAPAAAVPAKLATR